MWKNAIDPEAENDPIETSKVSLLVTHRNIFILTKVQLGIDGSISQFWKVVKELGNKLSRQPLLLWTALHSSQDDLVSIFVLQNKKKDI